MLLIFFTKKFDYIVIILSKLKNNLTIDVVTFIVTVEKIL